MGILALAWNPVEEELCPYLQVPPGCNRSSSLLCFFAGSTSSSLSDHWLMRLGSYNSSTRGSLLSWSSAPCPSVARVPDSPVFTNGVCLQDKGMWLDWLSFLLLHFFIAKVLAPPSRERKEPVLTRSVSSLGGLPNTHLLPLHPSTTLHPTRPC